MVYDVDYEEELLVDRLDEDLEPYDPTRDIYDEGSVQTRYRPARQSRIPGTADNPRIPLKDKFSEDFQWWQEQIDRCLYGWIAPDGHYINGIMYFYLNFVTIPYFNPETDNYEWEPTLYRDNDEDILNIIWANTPQMMPNGKWSNGKNHIEAKPRGIAWTTFTLLGVALWTFVFRPELGIGCAYPDDKIMKEERLMFQTAWSKLHPLFKRWKNRTMESLYNSSKEFSIGIKGGRKDVVQRHNFCKFDSITGESAGVYKGLRLNLMIAVEAGKWKGTSLKNYHSENEPSIKLGRRQWGMLLIGGTSNAIINKSTAYKEIYFNPEAYNATTHFTPVTKVLKEHIDYYTGKSLEKRALKTKMAEREKKKADPQQYQQEIIENPLNITECFIPNIQLAYSAGAINDQMNFIKENHLDSLWMRGRLEYAIDASSGVVMYDTVHFHLDPKGDWYMNSEGTPNYNYDNLDVAGIDDRMKSFQPGKKRRKDASKNAMVVWRRPSDDVVGMKTDIPVGVYFGDLPSMPDTYDEFLKGIIFWNIKQTLYEYNAEGFIMHMRDKNQLHRLYHHNGDPGIKIRDQDKIEQTYLGGKFFAVSRHKKITNLMILQALLMWGGDENTDIGSAFHLVLMLLNFTKAISVSGASLPENRQEMQIIKLGQYNGNSGMKANPNSQYIKLGGRPH